MKRFIPLILLIFFLFITEGYYLCFRYLQNKIRKEIKQEIKTGLSDADLVLIIVHADNDHEIHWTRKNKEFTYQGKMYDVVRTENKGKEKYIYCISDVRETQLITHFAKQRRRRQKVLWQLRKVIGAKYFGESFSLKISNNSSLVAYAVYRQFYTSRIIETASPPPKFNFFS